MPARLTLAAIVLVAGLAGEITLYDWLEFVGLGDDVDPGLVVIGRDGESGDFLVVGGIPNVYKFDRDLAFVVRTVLREHAIDDYDFVQGVNLAVVLELFKGVHKALRLIPIN